MQRRAQSQEESTYRSRRRRRHYRSPRSQCSCRDDRDGLRRPRYSFVSSESEPGRTPTTFSEKMSSRCITRASVACDPSTANDPGRLVESIVRWSSSIVLPDEFSNALAIRRLIEKTGMAVRMRCGIVISPRTSSSLRSSSASFIDLPFRSSTIKRAAAPYRCAVILLAFIDPAKRLLANEPAESSSRGNPRNIRTILPA